MRLDDAVFFAKRAHRDVVRERTLIDLEARRILSDMDKQAMRCRVHMFNLMKPLVIGAPAPAWSIGRFEFAADGRKLP